MNKKNYVALHNHSHYSTLDGYATIDEYIKAAQDNNMPGIGLADHGTASGLYKFITRTQKAGLIPVPGIEFYVAPENPEGAKNKTPVYYGRGGKRAPKYDVSNGAYTHMTVFAYNNVGVQNLFKLTSLSWKQENFYFKPRIDTNMLAEHSEGLIVTTGCPSSEVSRRFLLGQDDKAYEYAGRLKSIFGDNLYVEIMDHKMEEEELERILVPKQIKLAQDLDIKIIATNDSHYAFKEDAAPHERILAVSTKSKMSEVPNFKGGSRFAFSTPEYYIKPYEEMIELYPEEVAEEALANTIELMEKCKDIKLDYDPHLRPEIEIPEGYSEATYLQKLVYDGFVKKRGHQSKEIQAESVKRIKEEFEVIHSNDFISYFLVVHDYIDFAHKKGIAVGAGRGCFVPGTKVKANQGVMRNIENIKVGDKVQTHDTIYQTVENLFTYDVENEDMTRLTLSNGKVIESTSDHLIFSKKEGFMEAGDFKVGDVLLGPKEEIERNVNYSVPYKLLDEKTLEIKTNKNNQKENLSKDWHNEFEVMKVEHYKYTGKVYDIQVANVHNYNVEGVTVHNSVGGSEIAYVLDISNTDPIRFDLLFERFLSPGRGSLYQIEYVSGAIEEIPVAARKQLYSADNKKDKVVYTHELDPGDIVNYKDGKDVIKKIFVKVPGSAPDVDTDFHTEGREEVVQYCIDKYGEENVANIITFGTFKAKKAFKAMSTIYEVPFAAANRASNFIPGMQGAEASLDDIMNPTSPRYKEGEDFRQAIDNPIFNEVVEMATPLDGRISETGVHPCGVIISNTPLAGIIPTQVRQSDGKLITQWEYPELEALGLIKMDLLGLELLNTVQQTLENIRLTNESAQDDSYKREIPDMKEIIQGPMDDPKTYENLREGNTVGIFQLGSPGVRELLKLAKPTGFEDIATITALYRPGPMSMQSHVEWAERKNGTKEIVPIDESLKGTVVEDVLADTAGILVFQESLMQIATRYAGMTPYESDSLRKAMGKKKMNIMLSMKPKFIEGAVERGSTKKLAEKVWQTMEGFAEYGFNKCVSSDTLIATPTHGKMSVKDLYELQEENPNQDIVIYSMYEDGKIKPHTVSKVVKSGRKPLYKVKTESGKTIRITEDHRLLTTEGYGTIKDGTISVGNELITDEEWSNKISEKTRATRKSTMSKLNRTPENREQSKKWMKKYQSTLTHEDRVKHQQEIQKNNPERTDPWIKAGLERLEELRKDDEWYESYQASRVRAMKERMNNGDLKGFGRPTEISDGRIADSSFEAMAAEYLLKRNVEFEMHKPLRGVKGDIRHCDFYANGLYFEMDGLRRGRQHFVDNKYGEDIPFVYMTPENFGDVIDEAIMTHHIENGDKIVEIIEPKLSKKGEQYTEMTYDIEMKTDGPANFIADGIVSHNSHSVSYAINIYESIYLKTHFPSEFMAALIQQGFGKPERVQAYIQEAQRMKLRLGPVDINTSQVQMASTGANPNNKYDIVFGFSGIKQMNQKLAEAIVEERNENGNYKSVADFVSRISKRRPITASPLANLAIAGAFDSFGVSRKLVSEKAKMFIDSGSKKVDKGVSLFSMLGSESNVEDVAEGIEVVGEDFAFNELIKLEADRIGMFVSGHPTSRLGHIATMYSPRTFEEVRNSEVRELSYVMGTITQMKSKTNKSGNRSTAVLLDDGDTTLTTYLPREVSQAIEKGEELARIKKAKDKGEEVKQTRRSEQLKDVLADSRIKAIEPLELNEAYMFKVGTRGWGDNVNLVIHDLKKLYTAPDGSLPYELNVKSAAQEEMVEKIAKQHEGKEGSYVKVNFVDGSSRLLDTRVVLSIDFIMAIESAVGKGNIVTHSI